MLLGGVPSAPEVFYHTSPLPLNGPDAVAKPHRAAPDPRHLLHVTVRWLPVARLAVSSPVGMAKAFAEQNCGWDGPLKRRVQILKVHRVGILRPSGAVSGSYPRHGGLPECGTEMQNVVYHDRAAGDEKLLLEEEKEPKLLVRKARTQEGGSSERGDKGKETTKEETVH